VWCATGNSAPSNGYDITYVVDEPRRLTGGVTTLFGTNEGSLVMKLPLINSNIIIIITYAFLSWNMLPPALTLLPSLQTFKRALKTELFSRSYNNTH